MSDLNALTKLLRALTSWRMDADVSKRFAMRDNLKALLAIATEGPDGQPEMSDIFKTYATVPDLPPTADLWEIVFVSGVGTLYYWNGLMWNPLTSGGGPITAGQVLTTTATFHYILSALDTNVQLALETIDQMMAANLRTDTTNFDHNLGPTDTDVQTALETIDDMTFAGTAADVPVNAAGFVKNLSPTDTDVQTALETIDALTVAVAAADVSVDASGFANNLSPTDTDVQTALGTIDGLAIPADASEVPVDASGFAGNLSPTDTDVQTALGTIDGLVIPSGDVVGPASAVDKRLCTFNAATGKLIQDAGCRFYGALGSDPSSPTPAAGDMYFNTAISMLMLYDAGRSKWLSLSTATYQFNRTGSVAAGAYLKQGETAMQSDLGIIMPFNATVVTFTYHRTNNLSATFEMDVIGVGSVYTLATGTNYSDYKTDLNINVNAGQIITIQNQSGGNTLANPIGAFTIRRRA